MAERPTPTSTLDTQARTRVDDTADGGPDVLGELPRWCAARFGARTAFVVGDEHSSYHLWQARTERVAQSLVAGGLAPGDRVAVLALNGTDFFDAYAGVTRAGGVAVPLGTRLGVGEVVFVLEHSEARWLAHDAAGRDTARAAADAVPGLRLLDLGALPAAPPAPVVLPRPVPDDVAAIFYTSGSTADPKGVTLTHANVLACVRACAAAFRVDADDVAYGVLPLYHTSVHFIPLPTLLRGGTVVLEEGFSAASAFAAMERHGVTLLPTVTSIAVLMAKHHRSAEHRPDLSALRKILLGGGGVPTSLVEAWQEIAPGAAPVNCYGMTEMAPAISVMDPSEVPLRPGSVGLPYPGNEIRIEAADGGDAPTGEVGEILVRGPSRMVGYWRNEEATAAVLRDGWLATGDLGRLDDDGYLTIVGRAKWMLKRGGENVFPDEVEAVLIRHDAVNEVMVVGVPDEVMGERVAAVVALRPGADLDAAALRAWSLERLAAFKVPDLYVLQPDELPKNAVGKIDAARLKRDAAQGAIAWTDVRRPAGR